MNSKNGISIATFAGYVQQQHNTVFTSTCLIDVTTMRQVQCREGMGIIFSPGKRNNSSNENAKLSTRHSDKLEAPKQTTSESTELETTVGIKYLTLETDISNGLSNQRGRSIETPTNKHSQTSANCGDQRNASGDTNFKRHASSKSKTAEWQIQYTGPEDDTRTNDSGLPAMDAKDASISATPSSSREEKRKVKSVNRNGEVSYTTKEKENHAITDETKKMHEYERMVKRLEAEVIKLTQEKNQLLTRQAPDVLEQKENEDRENKPRKTKENERNDDVSYMTKNQATDSANDRKKINEYEKKVESLEADIIKLTQEKNQLLNRREVVSYTTITDEIHARNSANESEKIHEYKRKVERLEAEIIKVTQEKNQLLTRQAPDVLEQKENEDRENKPRKTKENERNDDVSYMTKNQATDSANDRKKINEYDKKVESLEADIIKLTQEKNQLLNRREVVSYTTITDEIHARNSANESEKIHEYKRKVERLEAEIIKVTQEKNQLLNRNDEVSSMTKSNENHATDSANDRNMIHEFEKKVERLEADIIKLTQEKDQLLNRRDDVSHTTNTDEIHATDLTKDRNKYHEYETKVESLEADVMKLRKENETLLKRLTYKSPEEQNEDGQKKPQNTMEEKRCKDVSYTTNTANEKHAADLTNDGNKLHEYERKVGCLEADVIKLREEKDKLLHRLSEIGAIKLTENNHKVTDLSDENRPEKVAEQFSELYDIEWTDAYENLTKIQCKQADWSVKQLLDVLKETYTMCVSSTQEKMKALKEAISNFLGLTARDVTDLDFKETKKRIQEHRKKMFQRNISNIGEEVRAQLKQKLDKEIYECLSDYIGKCVIICWNMCTKEPPMYLDFGDWKQAAHAGDKQPMNMPFDKLKFMTYTKSGDYVDYVVWPAVYVCEGGPLMKKGVAQGSKIITNTMEVMEN